MQYKSSFFFNSEVNSGISVPSGKTRPARAQLHAEATLYRIIRVIKSSLFNVRQNEKGKSGI